MEKPKPSGHNAFFLDIDGTLVDLAPTPDTVVVPDEMPALLFDLYKAAQGAVAIVSGRSIPGIQKLFPWFPGPLIGQHGAERLIGGVYARDVRAGDMNSIETALHTDMPKAYYRFFENKGATLAIHTDNDVKADLMAWLTQKMTAHPLFQARDFSLISGHRVVEIKASALSKGTACTALMQMPDFSGRTPIYCGDDATDRDGFAFAHAHKGLAVGIGPYLQDVADIHLATPDKLRDWLRNYVAANQAMNSG